MTTAMAILALVSLFPGAFITLAIAVFGRKHGDPGCPSLVFPMTALFCLTFFEFLRLLSLLLVMPQASRTAIPLLEDASRIALSFAWVSTCHRHNVLNGVKDIRPKLTPVFAAVAALSLALLAASRLFGLPLPAETVSNIQVAAFLFYAAVTGLLLLWRKPVLLPSTRVILALAGISLVVYPLVSLADIFGFSYPGMEAGVPVWMQTQSLYYILVCIPMFHFVRRRFTAGSLPGGLEGDEALSRLELTEREKAIVSLLLRGETYKGIAHELGISMATVKTHVNKAYGKIGVQSRSQLQAFLSGR